MTTYDDDVVRHRRVALAEYGFMLLIACEQITRSTGPTLPTATGDDGGMNADGFFFAPGG